MDFEKMLDSIGRAYSISTLCSDLSSCRICPLHDICKELKRDTSWSTIEELFDAINVELLRAKEREVKLSSDEYETALKCVQELESTVCSKVDDCDNCPFISPADCIVSSITRGLKMYCSKNAVVQDDTD